MRACCAQTSPPTLLKIGPQHALPSSFELEDSAKKPVQVLEETLHSVPPLASKEARALLTSIRNRQEQLFEQVLDQQKAFQKQLIVIQSDVKDSANAQDLLKRHFENFMADVSSRSRRTQRATVLGETQRATVLGETTQTNTEAVFGEAAHNPVEDMPAPRVTVMSEDKSTDPGNEVQHYSTQKSAVDTAFWKTMQGRKSVLYKDNMGPLENMGRVLRSKSFEMAVAVAIMINAFVMCWEIQYQGLDVGFNLKYPGRPVEARFVWSGAHTVFTGFDWFFGCLFLLEMILKLVCWRQHYFYKIPEIIYHRTSSIHFHVTYRLEAFTFKLPNFVYGVQCWNLLDSVSVAAFLFDKMMNERIVNPQMLRLIRMCRLGRLVRLLRFLESLDHLYVMTTAISGLKRILGWAMVLLTLMLLACDLFLVQLLQVTYFEGIQANDLTEEQLKKYHEMYEYFGTTTRCMLSMFEVTLGNWPPIARLLSEEVSEWFTLVCLAHKLTIGFAVVGVITGCILQETFKVAQTDDFIMFRQQKMAGKVLAKKMEALFEALDISCDGRLQVHELEAIGSSPEIRTWLSSLGIETSDLRTLFDLIDVDGDGTISLDELVARIPRIQGSARSIDVLAIQKQLWRTANKQSRHSFARPEEQASFADLFLM